MDSIISNLPLGPSIVGTEAFPADNSTETAQYTLNALKTWIISGGLSSILAVSNTTGANTIVYSQGTANTVPIINGSKQLVSSTVTATQLGYLSGASGNIQSQIDNLSNVVGVLNSGVFWKEPVRAASTANVSSLTGTQTIDGVSLVADDRVLLKNQTQAHENGIYLVKAGAWTRASDFLPGGKIAGARVSVNEGYINADKLFTCTNDNPVNMGSDAIVFVEAGGTSVSGTSNRITVSGGVVDIASNYAGQNTITTLGTITTGVWNGTAIGTGYTEAKIKGSLATGGLIAYSSGIDTITNNSRFEYNITGTYSYVRLISPNNSNHCMFAVDNLTASLESIETALLQGRDIRLKTTSGQINLAAGNGSVNHMIIKSTGIINFSSLPTSATGLAAGDLWNNGGVLTIV